jgi:hypothetical protein
MSRKIKDQNEPQILKAVIYARVSSKDQEKEGFSIPSQLKLLQGYATSNRLAITNEYVDVETAKESGRSKFEEMLGRVHASCAAEGSSFLLTFPLTESEQHVAGATHVVLKRRKVRRSHRLQVPRAEDAAVG